MPKAAASIKDKRADKADGKTGIKKRPKKDSEDDAYVAKQTKGEKVKDPNAPKRPMSSYFHFMNAERNALKTVEPDLKFGELTKKLTDRWKALSDKEKKKYEELAATDKERYTN